MEVEHAEFHLHSSVLEVPLWLRIICDFLLLILLLPIVIDECTVRFLVTGVLLVTP